LFKYQLRIYGGKVETNGADQIFFYPASNDWSANSVTWNHRPPCNYSSEASLYLNSKREYRMVDVDKAVRKALAEGKTEISWYIGGDRQGNRYHFDPADSQQEPMLMLMGFKNTPEI
ncbi:TPA: DNRLRE domain-containing protein, partial [Klebsiella michiganensis]